MPKKPARKNSGERIDASSPSTDGVENGSENGDSATQHTHSNSNDAHSNGSNGDLKNGESDQMYEVVATEEKDLDRLLRVCPAHCRHGASVSFKHAAGWLRDNPHIHKGYRTPGSWRQTFFSIFSLHNETVNIWTHLIGAVLVVILLISTMLTTSPYGIDRILTLKNSLVSSPSYASSSNDESPSVSSPLSSCDELEPGSAKRACQAAQSSWKPKASTAPLPEAALFALRAGPEGGSPSSAVDPELTYTAFIKQNFLDMFEFVKSRSVPALEYVATSTRTLMHQGSESTSYYFSELASVLDTQLQSLKHAIEHSPTIEASVSQLSTVKAGLVDSVTRLTAYVRDQPALKPLQAALTDITHGLSVLLYLSPHDESHDVLTYLPVWPLAVFMVSAAMCLSFSTFFHAFAAVSETVSAVLQRLDYAGITLLISGSNVPIVYYGFYCEPWTRHIYISAVIFFGLVVFVASVSGFLTNEDRRVARVLTFVVMGLAGIVPMSHLILHFGEVLPVFWYVLGMAAFYLSGALLYSSRFPERCHPGHFDTFGSSHQIFHILVILAVITHYIGLVQFYEWRILRPCSQHAPIFNM